MSDDTLPPCGLYRTTQDVAGVSAGRLVYFHNHGNPGPGLYLPASWQTNRATFEEKGFTLPDPPAQWARTLDPLPPEGLYRVSEAFHCCDKLCRLYEKELLVQVGYDGAGLALLFVPEWTRGGLAVPERGTLVELESVRTRLVSLRVPESKASPSPGRTASQLH